MPEVMVIFSLAAMGSLMHYSIDFALQFFARKMQSESVASGPDESQSQSDPLVAVGLTLTCYGAIALGLVLSLPGQLAIQRTWLAFALLCVGGLIGEIAHAGTESGALNADADETEGEDRTPGSLGLAMTLMLALNLAVAVLASGQGLVVIVPPAQPVSEAQRTELEPIVVVAGRGSDPLATSSSFL